MAKITKSDIRAEFAEFIKSDIMDCEECRNAFYNFMLDSMCKNRVTLKFDGSHMLLI